MKKIVLILGIALGVVGCKKSVAQFEEAQPKGVSSLTAFPNRLMGSYHDYENDVRLQVTAGAVLREIYVIDTISSQQLMDKDYQSAALKKINDSTYTYSSVISDTIFAINKGDVIKKFKGFYFVNAPQENGKWEVSMLEFKNNLLHIGEVVSETDLSLLQQITETKVQDSIRPATFNPTKKQFKEFVKKNGFTTGNTYMKIN